DRQAPARGGAGDGPVGRPDPGGGVEAPPAVRAGPDDGEPVRRRAAVGPGVDRDRPAGDVAAVELPGDGRCVTVEDAVGGDSQREGRLGMRGRPERPGGRRNGDECGPGEEDEEGAHRGSSLWDRRYRSTRARRRLDSYLTPDPPNALLKPAGPI